MGEGSPRSVPDNFPGLSGLRTTIPGRSRLEASAFLLHKSLGCLFAPWGSWANPGNSRCYTAALLGQEGPKQLPGLFLS